MRKVNCTEFPNYDIILSYSIENTPYYCTKFINYIKDDEILTLHELTSESSKARSSLSCTSFFYIF